MTSNRQDDWRPENDLTWQQEQAVIEVAERHDRMLEQLTKDAIVINTTIETYGQTYDGFQVRISDNFPNHMGIYEFMEDTSIDEAISMILHFYAEPI